MNAPSPEPSHEETTPMTLDLTTITLAKGRHHTRDDGVCLMEAVAWFAGKGHTDAPPCVPSRLLCAS